MIVRDSLARCVILRLRSTQQLTTLHGNVTTHITCRMVSLCGCTYSIFGDTSHVDVAESVLSLGLPLLIPIRSSTSKFPLAHLDQTLRHDPIHHASRHEESQALRGEIVSPVRCDDAFVTAYYGDDCLCFLSCCWTAVGVVVGDVRN